MQVPNALKSLSNLIPRALRPVLKAIVGAVVPLLAVSLATGTFDWKGIASAVCGALAVYLAPNRSATPPTPEPAVKTVPNVSVPSAAPAPVSPPAQSSLGK